MPDYELLELTLFAAMPRRDTKPLAKALLARFGSFAEVIAAPRERLLEVQGVGEGVVNQLKIVEAAAHRLAKTSVINRPALSSWTALLDYCTAAMARAQNEEFRVLFLDRKNVLIADEVQKRGTVDHTPVYPREIVKRALELSRLRHHPGAQSSQRRSHAVQGRHRHDARSRRRRQGAGDRRPRPSGDRPRRPCQLQVIGITLEINPSARSAFRARSSGKSLWVAPHDPPLCPRTRWSRSGRPRPNSASGSRSRRMPPTPWPSWAWCRRKPRRRSGKKARTPSSTWRGSTRSSARSSMT